MRSKVSFYNTIGKRNNVTIPSKIINAYFPNLQRGSIFLTKVRNLTFYSRVSYQNFSYSLYLPKVVVRNLDVKPGDKIKIRVIDVISKKLSRSDVSRLNFKINKEFKLAASDVNKKYKSKLVKIINSTKNVDMKRLLAGKIKIRNRNASFIIKDGSNGNLVVSYKFDGIKRKFKPVIIKRYIPLYPFVQFLGFYIGDGTTSSNTSSVSFINTDRGVVAWNMNFLKTHFKSTLKYSLVYGPTKPNKKISRKIRKFWRKIGIKNFNWSINEKYKNPSKFGAMRVRTSGMSLKLIILKSLDEFSIEATNNPTIAKHFLKGLAMSDMYPSIKYGILESVSVAFEKGNEELMNLYLKIFKAYGMKARRGREKVEDTTTIVTYRIKDFIRIFMDDIFEFHKERKNRFLKGLLRMELFRRYVERLRLFLDKPISAPEFADKAGLHDTPYRQLERLIKFELLDKINTYPRLYFLTDRGKEILNKLKSLDS